MKVVRTIPEVRGFLEGRGRVALVPTMGAFHEGHLHLMREAKRLADCVVVSLFVNPTQFGPAEDLAKYPRREDADARMASDVGVDLLFAPEASQMYPRKTTTVHVSDVTEPFEGAERPGHFDGVSTIVLKLFNIVKPDIAVFGLKDLQQCSVVRRMVEDLDLDVALHFVETVREASGLALSSRNDYLSAEDRLHASKFYATLISASSKIRLGEKVGDVLTKSEVELKASGFSVDYVALVDPVTMLTLEKPIEGARIVAAVRFKTIRLLDNVPL